METTTSKELAKVQTRKPYTITKRREKWTDEEHNKFLEAIELYGRAWQRIQEHVGSKTAVQIRSHAQKFFLKLQKGVGGMCAGHPHGIEIPPPRPKRKPCNPSDEVKASNNCSENSVWPNTDKLVMDAKCKKPVAQTTEESMKCNSCASVHCGNSSSAYPYPLPDHLQIIGESVKKADKFFHLFEMMNGNFTNPQMNSTPEERHHQVLNKMDKPFTSPNQTLLLSEESYQNANADLSLSLNPSRLVTNRSKDPAMPSSINQPEDASVSLSKLITNSFSKLHAEASIAAASLMAHNSADSSTVTNTNFDFGEAEDNKHGGNLSSSNISAIIAATVDAATAWWRLNGLLTSNISSAMAQNRLQNGTIENTKWQSSSTLLEPSSSSPDTVEKIRVERTEKPANQYMISSTVQGNDEVNQALSKTKHDDSPFSEQLRNDQQLRNAGRFSKPYSDRPKQGPLAFEALFCQKVLPQSFGPMNMDDDDDEQDLNLGKEEDLGLQIDLNRKLFARSVFKPDEEENASSLNFKHRSTEE